MKYSNQENKLVEQIRTAIPDVTPGVTVRAYHVGRLVCDISVGQTYPYYDLSSLTKVIFTQQALMEAFDKGKWSLNSKLGTYLPDFPHADITLVELLTHTSGLPWWLPLFKEAPPKKTWLEKRTWLYEELKKTEMNKTGKAVYSDIGIMVLGFVLEKMLQKNLSEIWSDFKSCYYPNTTLDFHVENITTLPVKQFAPTEDCVWRKKTMRAEVHDENTWALGGISTHSGLFGSIEDVAAFGLNVRSQLQGIARYQVRQKTAQLFAARAIPVETGDWAMGYMMPTLDGASCGPHFSILSIGHTGFTGTSFWYDPRHDLLVLILSNRIQYGRENKSFIQLRPKIHNWIFESLKRTN